MTSDIPHVKPRNGVSEAASCPACGGEVHPWAERCVHCGGSLDPVPVAPDVVEPSDRATAALTLSILGVLLVLPIFSIPALALGLVELSAVRDGRSPRPGEVYALWAIFLAAVPLAALASILVGALSG